MIVAGTKVKLARVPLAHVVVTERGPMNADRVRFYVEKLAAAPKDADLSPVHLVPFTPDASAADGLGTKAPEAGMWQLVDGRHRFVASLIAGRRAVLGLLLSEPGWPGHELRVEADGWVEANAAARVAAR